MRWPRSAVIVVAAVGLFSYGLFADGLDIKVRIVSLVAGVLLLFVAVAMVASRVVRPLAFVLGAPGARFGGTAGQLARENAVRNPARTASTAAAVMIGLALITFVAVLGQGVRTSFTSAVDELFVADYAVTAGNEPLTSKAAQAAATAPGVEVVSEIRAADAKIAGKSVGVNGVDGNLTKVVAMKWAAGSGNVPAQLGRRRCVHQEALRRRPLARRRFALGSGHTDRHDAAAPRRKASSTSRRAARPSARCRSRLRPSTTRSQPTTTSSPC